MDIDDFKKSSGQDALRLWYRQPASCWKEAVPLGNGRMGAMVYGNPGMEILDLTEITCFSGEESSQNNAENAHAFFYTARAALIGKDYERSRQYLQRFIGKRLNYGTQLPLGHLVIDTGHRPEDAEEYTRRLQLNTALAAVGYRIGDTCFTTTAWISNPHQVMVIKMEARGTARLNVSLSLDGGNNPYRTEMDGNNDLLLYGSAYESIHSDGKTGVDFHGRVRVVQSGGTADAKDHQLHIRDASDLLLFIALGTSFEGLNPVEYCKALIEEACRHGYEKLLDAHLRDFGSLFDRVELMLEEPIPSDIPTDLLLEQVKSGRDIPALAALMFQYGRYLLISSSRESSPLPAPLQGVWNDDVACRIGWTCDMHLDINTQMNYWPAEAANLPECHEPLFRWIEERLVPSGRVTAAASYGLKGWAAELVSNAWGFTAPYWHTNLSPCPTGGAWVATHLWEHFLFTRDATFLKERAYPVLKGCAEFFIDYLFEDPETGYLTSGPSISPENLFTVDGQAYSASLGPTYEIVLIREIFEAFLQASEVLECPDKLVERVKSAVVRLLPFKIGPEGELKEWAHEYASVDPQHRHTSHLLSLYPFHQITPEKTPALADAAKTCIKLRMTPEESWEDTGWARSMLMLYASRLRESEAVHGHILSMQRYLTNNNLMVKHPPTRGAPSFADVYELDGNTGLTACIAEVLLQSHNDEIHLLPSLPEQWAAGRVKGLCARGGFEVGIIWKDGVLVEAVIYSRHSVPYSIRYGNDRAAFHFEAGKRYRLDRCLKLSLA